MDDYENDLDAESLQAQIDMSLAHTQSLVSSWLKPKYGSGGSSSSRVNQEKELEELMKRPPRLGVGAPIPTSTGVASHEAMKLKGKLTGKKRSREEEDVKMAEASDEESESRARAIQKKAKPDPFAPKAKKQKANAPEVVPIPNKPVSKKEANKLDSLEAPSKTKMKGTVANAPSTTASKKQDKTARNKPDTPTNQGSKSADEDAMEVDKMLVSPTSSSTPPPGDKPASKPTPQGIPVLNLDGPPPAIDSSPSKKKRKRSKKKKKVSQSRNASS
ncbi:uncharacterized protein PHACADRAFT_205432 [Phanerochaete carnosa HHB-10118-sp]|uniref:Uncharacterized protein n=1 Tax=Phanerochaete carnosa (strain HHB-10118-sp) TaxID=650164 RepID=K5V8U0_PHACS|nr:uncharacterized protein PHACADRAFT_205432 [Phanerochaete carnosa HHB-10118-sp]EKM59251.1 hypothetical protein PHACADRAFT_205432 [Phanerochaete carnosa HHB-10118-sp]